MLRKSFLFIITMLIIIFYTAGQIFSMPPHPRLIKLIKAGLHQKAMRGGFRSSIMSQLESPARSTFPSHGNCNVLVILTQYPDLPLDAISTVQFYSNLLNADNSVSVKKYYQDMSQNLLNLNFTVVGPYTVSKPSVYYGANSTMTTNINGNSYSVTYDAHPAELAGEAVDLAASNGINFTPYDNDGDGIVETVMIIHSGPGEEIGLQDNAIWSQSWDLDKATNLNDGSGPRVYNGKTINGFTIEPEFTFAAGDSGIGVFAHEFGHKLGLPDLYDVSYETSGVGDWSLMSSGAWLGPQNNGEMPAPLLAWEKVYLGWISIDTADSTLVKNIYGMTGHSNNKPMFNKKGKLKIPLIIPALILTMAFFFFVVRKKSFALGYSIILASLFCGFLILNAIPLTSCTNSPGSDSSSSSSPVSHYSLKDIESGHRAVKVPVYGTQQYLLIENKVRKSGTWTEFLPGDGLLISFIYERYLTAQSIQSNMVDCFFDMPHGVEIVEADNNFNLWLPYTYGDPTDPYFSGNNSSLNINSAPVAYYYPSTNNDTAEASYSIENIGSKGDSISFSVH